MIWNTLLQLRAQLQKTTAAGSYPLANSESCANDCVSPSDTTLRLATSDGKLELHFDAIGKNQSPLIVTAPSAFAVELHPQHRLDSLEQREIEWYMPYALLPFFSQQQNKTFAISHFAQTLDGRIASSTGDSKWIGNQANLTHAHKMRALCDAILVGASTLKTDQPRLDVRHVAGANPIRVLVGNNITDSDIVCDNHGRVIVINTRRLPLQCEQITLHAKAGKIDGQDILQALYERGLNSIYIEGGATTTSLFLRSFALDQVQIHVSPRILGSGTTGFNFRGVHTMDQAVDFENPRFLSIDDHIMFIGEVAQATSAT